ncbi:transferrin-like [Leptidea sinapis]|uniref:transferrin-like n=1 Tax=Leptidea sinapis TaxID=189913 RepID=UPI0021350313|nr:transferrin-like [Leptidea sinapis]
MEFKLLFFVSVIAAVSAQSTYKVCFLTSNQAACQSLDRGDSQVICELVESRIDCALKLARGEVDFGTFTEEEMLLLSQQQPEATRVVASIRDVTRTEPFAFEAVAVVPSNHTGGLEGLRGGSYCHPGLDEPDLRWSPRVLKTFEKLAARTDRCPDADTNGRTADELEVMTLNDFFSSACRPGPWSSNATVDQNLKRQFPSLCSLCGGENSDCSRYNIDMGVSISGVSNDNRHIQALECLRRGNGSRVAYVAWQHVREFFNIRAPQDATSYALMCEDGTIQVLTNEVLAQTTAPCSLVKQPWSAIVATPSKAEELQLSLRTWWPNGANPGGNTWQAVLFQNAAGGSNARVAFEENISTPLAYLANIRNITSIDAAPSCIPARRWCTISSQEHTKCTWVRTAAYSLGIEPAISCQQRSNIFECLRDIRDNNADFIAAPSNYGYIARQHYKLTSVKLVQNSARNPAAFSRVAAVLKTSTAASEITRFENLRGKKACFPEFSGIAYVAFVSAAHERDVISSTECDYMKSVGEFFDGACAPGAVDASHALSESSFNASVLCSHCQPSSIIMGNYSQNDFTCAYDYSNLYYGNNGTAACLANPNMDVAFVELQNFSTHLRAAGLNDSTDVRILCRNNTLAAYTGLDVDHACLLAYVVDSEVLARRDDPLLNSLNVLLDALDEHFGYNAAISAQLVNLEIYSPFDSVNDLLFKDTVVGLAEPSSDSPSAPANNYNNLFRHLDSCTSSASRTFFSFVTFAVMAVITRFVVY